MREHVHHACGPDMPAAFVVQDRAVARQRRGITGNVDDAGRAFVGRCEYLAKRLSAFARRINLIAVDAVRRIPKFVPIVFTPREEIAGDEVRFVRKAVRSRSGAGAFHHAFASFEARHLRSAPCQGEREVSYPAEEVRHIEFELHDQ